MVKESELSFRQYSLTVSKWLMYLESGNFNITLNQFFTRRFPNVYLENILLKKLH